jgi:hypothetical protein
MITRRGFLMAMAAAGCSRASTSSTPLPTGSTAPNVSSLGSLGRTRLVEWTMRTPDERVVVMLPDPMPVDKKLRAVIALHGRGEALKAPESGAMGWPRDYALVHAYERISNPPLASADFESLVEPGYLESKNHDLSERKFGGLAVICPYVPDLDPFDAAKVSAYGRYLVDVVLDRAKKELPIFGARESIGIDGVSLGGIVALLVGLGNPSVFGAVGALQPAISPEKISYLTTLAAADKGRLPKLRLTTSRDDYFRAAIAQTTADWNDAGIAHDFSDLPGPHDYVFNRGPGAMELLFWQDRALTS